MKKPVVELSDCILCQVCEAECPQVFALNQAGYIEVADLEKYPGTCVDEAIKHCPANCIFWEED